MANGGIIGPVIEPTLSSTNGGDKITTFTSSGTFTVSNNNGPKAVHYLVVGGGGSSAAGNLANDVLVGGGGGGGGGFRSSFRGGTALTIPGSTPVTVEVQIQILYLDRSLQLVRSWWKYTDFCW